MGDPIYTVFTSAKNPSIYQLITLFSFFKHTRVRIKIEESPCDWFIKWSCADHPSYED
jgi:hypothetical protein